MSKRGKKARLPVDEVKSDALRFDVVTISAQPEEDDVTTTAQDKNTIATADEKVKGTKSVEMPTKAPEKKRAAVDDERFRVKAVAASDEGTILFTDHDNQHLYCSKSGKPVTRMTVPCQASPFGLEWMQCDFRNTSLFSVHYPGDVTTSPSNPDVFYMADSNGSALRRLDLKTHQATVLKTPSRSCLRPGEQPYLLLDGDKLYISCYWASAIYVYGLKTDKVELLVGSPGHHGCYDGPAKQAMFRHTSKPCLDREGNLIIPDTDNHRIRMLRRSSGDVISIIGNGKGNSTPGPAQKCSIRYPASVHCDSAGNLLISCQVHVYMYEASTGLVSLVPSLTHMTITHRTSLGRLYGYNSSGRNVISAVSKLEVTQIAHHLQEHSALGVMLPLPILCLIAEYFIC